MSNNRRDFLKLSTLALAAPLGSGISISTKTAPSDNYSILKPEKPGSYERWLWIELIGFDNEQKDYGVKHFLETTGFVPEAITFLLYSPDFIHTHRSMDKEWVFPPEYCSYRARPFSRERARQAWTNHQLRGLVKELKQRGIESYCSFFDFVIDSKGEGNSWSVNYPEIRETSRDGVRYALIHPLKRFTDGGLYEDFFLNKLSSALTDYGFSGFHAADGYSSGRRPLDDVDYSDDMVDQFLTHTSLKLPVEMAGKLDENKTLFAKRSRWIWKNMRQEWIGFHVDRWEMFYKKIVDKLHAMDRKVVFNTAWTRAPFEAVYRYGIDYHRVANTGMDGFVVEAAASAIAMEPELNDDPKTFHYNSMAMLMLIKAQAPNTPLRPFTGIHDTLEQYDALRHEPNVVEREILSMANLYLSTGNELKRCSSGPLCCLSDSVERHEWNWLKQRWDLGFSSTPKSIVGATLVWSNKAFDNQLADYIKTRRWSTHRILYELMALGTPVNSVVHVKDLDKTSGPLLILNPHLFPADELSRVLAYQKGPVILIGGKVAFAKAPQSQFNDALGAEAMSCAVFGGKSKYDFKSGKETQKKLPDDIPEPFSWTEGLYFRKVSKDFLQHCFQVLSDIASSPKVVTETDSIRMMTQQLDDNTMRLLVGSDSYFYKTPSIDIGREIEKITVKTSFPGVPVLHDGSKFKVRIPGKGMVILDVQLKS